MIIVLKIHRGKGWKQKTVIYVNNAAPYVFPHISAITETCIHILFDSTVTAVCHGNVFLIYFTRALL